MAIIYRLVEVHNGIREDYYRSIEGSAEAALILYKEYLLSKDLLYTEGVDPPDITAESIRKLIRDASHISENLLTVSIVCHGEYTLTLTEVVLND
jgi:hypothetical protein